MKSLLITAFAATFFVSCTSPFTPTVEKKTAPQNTVKPVTTTTNRQAVALPPPPPSTHVDKEVEDNNYQEQYMYPEDGSAAKKDPDEKKSQNAETSAIADTESMTKEACIAMIGQEKFDKYSEMFGSEEASIKRCGMMKAMQKR